MAPSGKRGRGILEEAYEDAPLSEIPLELGEIDMPRLGGQESPAIPSGYKYSPQPVSKRSPSLEETARAELGAREKEKRVYGLPKEYDVSGKKIPKSPELKIDPNWPGNPPFPGTLEPAVGYATKEEKAYAEAHPGEPVEIPGQPSKYGFMPGTQFQGIPPELRPDTGFYNPHYPSQLREAIDLGIVSLEDGRRLYAEYDKFKNSPEGLMMEAKRMEDFAKGEQGRFGKDIHELEADELDQVASQWEDYGQRAQRLENERQAFMSGFREDYERQLTSYKMAMDDLRRVHRPRKQWGDKLMAGIAVALGALGSAISRTPNYALQILMKNVDTEMAQYDMDLKRGKNLVYMESNLLGQMRAKMKNEEAAHSATRQFLIQDTINRIKSVAASSDSSIIRKKADAAIAGLSAELKVENKKIQAQMSGAAKQAAMLASLGARRSAAAKAQQEALGGFVPLDKTEEVIFGGPDIGDWVVGKGDKVFARKMKEAVAAGRTETGVADELSSLLRKGIPSDPATIYRVKQLSTMMMKAMITERGANLTELEVKLLRAMSGGDPGTLPFHLMKKFQPEMMSGVRKFKQWRVNTAHNRLKAAQGRQVQAKRILTDEGKVHTLKKEMPETWEESPRIEFQDQ